MADFISRDYALHNIECGPWDTETDRNRAIHYVRELTPAANVRPVVRGKWVRGNENRTSPIKDSYICSVCGEKTLSGFCGNPAKTNFCPNCGADMRPDKNDQRGEQQGRENRKTLR